MNYTALALEKNYPNAKWTMTDGIEIHWEKQSNGTFKPLNFIWHDSTPQPTKSEIDQMVEQVKQEVESQKYKQQRYREYPSIGDQLDALFKAGLFPEDMAATIQAVKDKYPKGK
jgi:hypothetical protein